jgi:hypothetical protein
MRFSEAYSDPLPTGTLPAGDQDVTYAAAMFLLAARMAERAIASADAAGTEILSGPGAVDRLFDNWASLIRQTIDPETSDGPCLQVTTQARAGLHRCLACGRVGIRGFAAASPLVLPHQVRTWRCVDRLACRTRRLQRSDPQ